MFLVLITWNEKERWFQGVVQFVLKNNFFKFNNEFFQLISGTVIGTKFAQPYACIFMDQLETTFLRTQSHKPMVWFRYIDNIFLFRLMVKKNLKSLWQILMPSIPIFTYEWCKKSIDFLDLDVALYNGKLESTVHITPTDRHQYLHYSSSHPRQTKRSIVSSQTLCISRICSREKDFQDHCLQMWSWFLSRK